MNTYQKTLYANLMALAKDENLPFYSVDQVLDGATYRIFSYRLASYTEFMLPGAIESRGIMFHIDSKGEALRVASLPMNKFFNLNENPSTMGLDLSTIVSVQDKMDGSLISTYLHYDTMGQNPQLRLKSKTSLQSEQAVDAMNFLNGETGLYSSLYNAELDGLTVNLEWTAPHNRIVLPYQKPQLTVLNARVRDTGEYLSRTLLEYRFGPWLVADHIDSVEGYKVAFIESVKDMTGIEGYVIRLSDGTMAKIKNDWYLSLHKLKDNVNSPKNLFMCVVNEAHDDLRAAFPEDEYIQNAINEMEKRVVHIYTDIKHYVDGFYAANKELSRKDFAIKAQAEVPKMWFGPLMMVYTGKTVDYKEYLIKRYKDFGISDEQAVE